MNSARGFHEPCLSLPEDLEEFLVKREGKGIPVPELR